MRFENMPRTKDEYCPERSSLIPKKRLSSGKPEKILSSKVLPSLGEMLAGGGNANPRMPELPVGERAMPDRLSTIPITCFSIWNCPKVTVSYAREPLTLPER